ncbi:MAG: hypothetical protein ACE5EF_08845, partial [Dehalococcoidia bacterium]
MTRGLDPATIEQRIRTYESFGIHRTGWPGDDQSARWVADELGTLGLDAELERFEFPRVELRRARLSWSDGEVEGVPLYDGGFTLPGGATAQLVQADSEDVGGRIAVAAVNDRDYVGRKVYERMDELEADGAVALVLPRSDPEGDVGVVNAEKIGLPLVLPVLQVAARDTAGLDIAATIGTEATVEIDGNRLLSRAANVVASLPGAEPDLAPIGIMTPRSGWFTCASERGGGIAILLALAEALAARRDRRRTVHFLASSGHELHHHGLVDYLRRRPGIEGEALAWLHLGANIGTSTGPTVAESLDDGLETQAAEALAAEAVRHEIIRIRGGEAVNIAAAGGRYISFRGGNRYFHSPNDTFDRACDADQVAAAGRAALRIVEEWL